MLGIGNGSTSPSTGGGAAAASPGAPPQAPATAHGFDVSSLRAVLAGLGTVLLLLLATPLWRRLRQSQRLAVAAGPAAGAAYAEPPAGTAPAAFQIWRSDLDDVADLAALTAPPEERDAALRRRAEFSSEEIARRLTLDLQETDDSADDPDLLTDDDG